MAVTAQRLKLLGLLSAEVAIPVGVMDVQRCAAPA